MDKNKILSMEVVLPLVKLLQHTFAGSVFFSFITDYVGVRCEKVSIKIICNYLDAKEELENSRMPLNHTVHLLYIVSHRNLFKRRSGAKA